MDDLRRASARRQKEWDTGAQLTLAYRGNELAGEVGEACNVIKKLERERLGIRGSRATVNDLADELADVIICMGLVAAHVGIFPKRASTVWHPTARDLCDLGNRLADAVGVVCGYTISKDRNLSFLCVALEQLDNATRGVAAYEGINLNAVVARKFNATSEKNGLATRMHVLYQTGDEGAPDVIKDRNGDVVLGLCRLCGRGEVELEEPCEIAKTRGGAV